MGKVTKTRIRVEYVDDPDHPGWQLGLTYAIPKIEEDGKKRSLPKVDVTYPAASPQCFTPECVARFESFGIDVERLTERLDFALRNAAQSIAGSEAKLPYQAPSLKAIRDRFMGMAKDAMLDGQQTDAVRYLDYAREPDNTTLTKHWAGHIKKV